MTQPSRALLDIFKPLQTLVTANPWLSPDTAKATPRCNMLRSLAAQQAEMQRAWWTAASGGMHLAGKLPRLYVETLREFWQLSTQARARLADGTDAAPRKAPAPAASAPRATRATAPKRSASRGQTARVKRDDLKKITGIGPVLEKKLNAAGIQTYAQIAAMGADDIRQLEEDVIRFSGRIKRDKWINQAKKLMKS